MGFRKGASIGLDISREYIGVVELLPGGEEVSLKKHGKIEIPPLLVSPSLSEENISEPGKFKDEIRNLFNSASISGKPLIETFRGRHISVAIPDASVNITFPEFEDIPKEREKVTELIKWNLKKNLPFPIDEAVVDYQVTETPSGGSRLYTLIAVLMRKAVLAQYENILNDLNLISDTIVPSSFAVYNFYHDLLSDVPACVVVTAHKNRIAVIALKQGKPHFYRSKEVSDEKDGLREILGSLNYYHNTCGVMPDRIYLINSGFETVDLKAQIETHFGAMDIKPIGISDVIRGAGSSMDIFAGAAGAALKTVSSRQ